MYAPTTELPTNLALTGLDARFFGMTFIIPASADAGGNRTIVLRIETIGSLSSASPQDENHDNVYQFKIQGNYRGEFLVADVIATITPVTAKATIIEGEAVTQVFGYPLVPVPDVTGDGRVEIGMAVQSGLGGASGYLIGSEFFSAMPGGTLSISNLGNAGAKFSQPTGSAALNNLVSSRPATSGVDIMLSDAAKNKFYLFPSVTSSSFGGLRGLPDPDASADAIVYSFPLGAPVHEARLIGDVNGDSRNDIFVRRASTGGGRFGIIFGRPVTSPSDRQRNADLDLEFTYPADGTSGIVRVVTELLSDVDGDASPDLLISIPSTNQVQSAGMWLGNSNTSSRGNVWVIRSSVLRSAGPMSIDLNALTSAQGKYLPDTKITSVVEFSDLDNDGFKTLLFGAENLMFAIDGNDLLGAQPGEFGPAARILYGSAYISDAGDIDGDGYKEVIFSASVARYLDVIRGASLKTAIETAPAPPARQSATLAALTVNLAALPSYTVADSRPPIVLGSSAPGGNGLIAYGRWCANVCAGGLAGSAGQIILIKIDDIRPWLNSATELKVKPN